ncbi:MAG: 16S rRNA (cytosine(967)-C(5))-methyltransferase RsmB [Candidatus Delongbacteria bacterium]|jgi:16S rRNA (cytosine967-C5)-methyltransferase|nr:16S rRNA (cytosine(967)-C(5))-methyltransferase RsmB [Candidatus Delongbacteria bacterium]
MNLRLNFYKTVMKVFNSGMMFESLYPDLLSGLDERDKRQLINLVNQFFRNFTIVEKILINKIDKKIDKQKFKVSMLLLCAGVEYFYLNSSKDYAVVNDYVNIAKKTLGLHPSKYINAILRKMTELELSEDELNSMDNILLSHPEWIKDRIFKYYSKDIAENILIFNQSIPPLFIRINNYKITKNELIELLNKESIEIENVEHFPDFLKITKGNPIHSKIFDKGMFYIQDPSHSLPVLVLRPNKNEKILDMCSAPGGKATYIQELTKNKTKLFLNDISLKKKILIKSNFKRLGVDFQKLTFQEAEKFQSFDEFDKILIDAPCSGSGNFRRHPESRWNKDEEQIELLKKLQLEILKRASKYVKKDGIIVYSTCSIFNDENSEIVEKFLEYDQDYILDNLEGYDTFKISDGMFAVNPGTNHYEGSFAARIKRVR